MAKTVQSRKSKGRRLQQAVVSIILDAFPELTENDAKSVPSGTPGEDIWLSTLGRKYFPFSIECKNSEHLNIWQAMKQAEGNNREMKPFLVFKRNNTEKYCTLKLQDFMDIMSELHKCRENK